MTSRMMFRCLRTPLAVALAVAFARPALAQASDTLAHAKEEYAAANYDGALRSLSGLDGKGAERTNIAAYEIFCLIALGQDDAASHAIEALVRDNPTYRPSDAEASPRVRAAFDRVRQPLVADIARDLYAQGKDAYDRRDFTKAAATLTRAVTLLDDPSAKEDASLADIRTLAGGFRDLANGAIASMPTLARTTTLVTVQPAVSPLATTALGAAPIYGAENADVARPVALSRSMPVWRPSPTMGAESFHGRIDLVIDQTGRVTAATMSRSVHPMYDPKLVAAATSWTFRPATRNGVPVPYRLSVDINLTPTAR